MLLRLAGRAVYPDGLYLALMAFHRRYGLPLWVTENGVADSTDHLRSPYLLVRPLLPPLLRASYRWVSSIGRRHQKEGHVGCLPRPADANMLRAAW